MEQIITWVQAVLNTAPARWIQLADLLPVELLRQVPAPGEWSPLECLQHLVDAERWVFPPRVRALLIGQAFPAFDPDSQGTKPSVDLAPLALAEEFARMRLESLELVSQLTAADLGKRARHQELGPVTLSELLHEWAAHDFNHTVQAERALMQPFIRGCGPWQPYFADHAISQK